MLRYLACASALALAVPAAAQTIEQPQPAAPSESVTEAPMDDAMPGESAAPIDQPTSEMSAAEPRPATDPAQIAAIIDQQFPGADTDSSGDLNQQEFATWFIPLQAAQLPEGVTADQTQLEQMAGTAFAQADADSSRSVTKDELTSYLTA